MQIRILFFGVLKDTLGRSTDLLDVPETAKVQDVLAHYRKQFPQFEKMLPSLALAVNQEYSRMDRVLAAGDEVAVLPPVSGGAPDPPQCFVQIVRNPIDTDEMIRQSKSPADGAVVVFDGVVRNNTRGRRSLYLDYEAYEEMALKQMATLAENACDRFAVRAISIAHRLGRLEIGETSVFIVVASAHRAAAFDACRWVIDTLKKTVPIWKKEFFEDGAVWADGEPFPQEIQQLGGSAGHQPASK